MSGQQNAIVFLSKVMAGFGIVTLSVGWVVMPGEDEKLRKMKERRQKLGEKFDSKDGGFKDGLPGFLQRKTPDEIRQQQSTKQEQQSKSQQQQQQTKPVIKAPENISKEQINVFKDL